MPEKILIIDDEPDMLKLLSMVLKQKTQYDVSITNNPIEAIEMVKAGGFDFILTDLKMPGLDGMELLESIRKFNGDIPVVILTAFATTEAASEAMKLGAFDFLTKPCRKEQILFTIDKALKFASLQKENRMMKERLKGSE
ncbi:MAG: response regulator [Nitrospirae bacterium]|nr:response regulator [Nitrospirota bacterium]